jgi:hypothetical protein
LVKTASQAMSTADLFGLATMYINNNVVHTYFDSPPRMDRPPRVVECRIFPRALVMPRPKTTGELAGHEHKKETVPRVAIVGVPKSRQRENPTCL